MGKFLVIALALLIGLVSCVSAPTSSPTQMPQELIGKWDMFIVSQDGGNTVAEFQMPFELFRDRFVIDNQTFQLSSQTYNAATKHYELEYSDGEKWSVRAQIYHGVGIIAVIVFNADGIEEIRFAAKPRGSKDFDFQKNLYHPGVKITNL